MVLWCRAIAEHVLHGVSPAGVNNGGYSIHGRWTAEGDKKHLGQVALLNVLQKITNLVTDLGDLQKIYFNSVLFCSTHEYNKL